MDDKDLDLNSVNEIDLECDCLDEDDFGGFGGAPVNAVTAPAVPQDTKVISASLNDFNGIDINKNYEDPNEDYSGYNQIDMECDFADDDDSFGGLDLSTPIKTENNDFSAEFGGEARPYQKSTGIMIDLSDDEPAAKVKETKSVLSDEENVNFTDDDPFGLNDDVPYDDTEELDAKELIDEDMVVEKKTVSQGAVEDNYWDELQKKHKKTNVKGTYNTHFHMSHDPKVEMDDFNHDMKSGSSAPVASGALASNSTAVALGDGEGCCEELHEELPAEENAAVDYSKLCKSLFNMLGFEVTANKNGYAVKDTCSSDEPVPCKNKEHVIAYLTPYIEDMFILPLQIETGENFGTCKEWADWYTTENRQKYPKCAGDIAYVDLVANHINECKF